MQTCRPAKCIEAIRVALLDPCTLLPVCGPLNGYAMGCIIDPNWTPEIEEGEESIIKDNCGNICLRDDRCDLGKRWNLEFKIKDPDKEFLSLIEGNPLIIDGEGNSIGVRQLSYGACTPFLFLELFERTDDCQPDGDPIYLRHIFPAVRLRWTGNEREGIFRILQIEGKTRDVLTDSVGTGPYDDIPATALVGASPTERIDYAWFEDDFVPAIQCGAIEVPCVEDLAPQFLSASSSDCDQFQITGTNLDLANHILIAGIDYYNPAGPDAGLNPVTATINAWTATLIDITDTQLTDATVGTVHIWTLAEVDAMPVDLGSAQDFSVLAGSTITNTGFTNLYGNLGLSPGTSVTGFPPGIVNGAQNIADSVAAQAQADLTTAYLAAEALIPTGTLNPDIGGETLTAGVYATDGTPDSLGITGTLTLDGEGDPNATFVFQIASTLITASGSAVTLINGAQPCNVIWQVGSSATIGDTSTFNGTILALTSISAGTGATVYGGLLARNGAVTLITDTVFRSICESPGGGVLNAFEEFLIADCPPGFALGNDIDFGESQGSTMVDADSTGRYLVSAIVDDGGGIPVVGVFRFLENGTLDATWGVGGLVTTPLGNPAEGDRGLGAVVDTSDDSVYISGMRDESGTRDVVLLKYTSLGVLDATFGTGGIVIVSSDGETNPQSLFIETTGEVVIGWTDTTGATEFGTLSRYDATGALVDDVQFSWPLVGSSRYTGDGLYAVFLDDDSSLDMYVGTADLTAQTINELIIAGDIQANSSSFTSGGVDVDGTDIYLSGYALTGEGAVAKFDGPTLAAVGAFGTGGVQLVGPINTFWHDVDVLSGTDLIVSGRNDDSSSAVTARLNKTTGAAVVTYGVAGYMAYPELSPVDLDSAFRHTLVEEADGRAVHAGYVDVDGVKTVIARTLLSDGSLDPSFG